MLHANPKLYSQTQPDLPFNDSVASKVSTAGAFGKTIRLDCPIGNIHVRDVASWIGELRCVGQVENLSPKFHLHPLGERE